MNREIKFRGISLDTGKWIIGYGVAVIPNTGDAIIIHRQGINITQNSMVEAKTVGQYTGLKDKNGVEIYEGDILTLTTKEGAVMPLGSVIWPNESAGWELTRFGYLSHVYKPEVIGNIHENKDLLNQ